MDSNNMALNEQRNKRKRIRKMKTGIVTFIGIWFMIITVVNVILCWRVIVLQNEVNALLRGKVEKTSVESAAPVQDISDETQEIGTLVTSDSGTGEEKAAALAAAFAAWASFFAAALALRLAGQVLIASGRPLIHARKLSQLNSLFPMMPLE